MSYTDKILFFMEIVGTVAFASSGAMLAIRKRMDLFGICVLGVTTAVGGGMTRDLLLGITPPNIFRNPLNTVIALAVSVIVFLILYLGHGSMGSRLTAVYDKIMMVFDAVGLGVFTSMGINTAREAGYDQTFLLVFVGVITGVGGGLLRDVMAQEKPYILTKHIYACASIAGALICVYTWEPMGNLAAIMLGLAVVIIVRFLAMHYRWNLPRLETQEEGEDSSSLLK